jgi:hypothetical protein
VAAADPTADCLKIDAPSYIMTHWPLFVIGAVYSLLVVAVGVTLEVGRSQACGLCMPGPAGTELGLTYVAAFLVGVMQPTAMLLQRSPPTGQALTLLHQQCVCPWVCASPAASSARCPRMRESPPHTPWPTSMLPSWGAKVLNANHHDVALAHACLPRMQPVTSAVSHAGLC